MTPKQYYENYLADDTLSSLSQRLITIIEEEKPSSVLEFGCGTGKNLAFLNKNIVKCGLDVSFQNLMMARYRHGLKFLILGDEYHLGHLGQFEVTFTCSVLDHIPPESIDRVIKELKSAAIKAVIIAETQFDDPENFYYRHEYESFGFEKIPETTWQSKHDGNVYDIWKFDKYKQ